MAHLADEDQKIEEELVPANASILIVDDVPANLLAMKAVLEPLGHHLVTARSGEEALRRLMSEDFALILMDVMMPEMDGYQTVALIKRRPKTEHVPIIFVSAIAKEVQHISKGYHYGAVDYITKPFDADILRAKVGVLVTLHLQAEKILRQQALLLQRRHELEQQRLQQRLTEEQSRMKDQFLAIISHELRTPLNVIVGWSDLLVSEQMKPEKTRAALESIQRNARLQKKLVDDLLDVSRMILGKLILDREETSLAVLVRSAVENANVEAAAKGVHVSQRIDPRCDAVTATVDTERMLQVLGNLLGNAVKFTPRGGHVEIALEVCDGVAIIRVSDDGVGIDAAELPFVFDRFWQAHHPGAVPRAAPGLGLGLAIVRQLVELHGGSVRAESDGAGRGSRFTVTLPIARARLSDESTAAPADRDAALG